MDEIDVLVEYDLESHDWLWRFDGKTTVYRADSSTELMAHVMRQMKRLGMGERRFNLVAARMQEAA